VDRDNILWLTGEHYQRQQPLSYHARRLPRGYVWYADPAGASEIAELRCAGFPVRLGNNALRPGIVAVSARLAQGTLRVLAGACPHLLREAELYRYGTEEEDRRTEAPVDEHNHALAALRYLVTKLDASRMAKLARGAGPSAGPAEEPDKPKKPADPWMDWRNEALWTRLF
jgi:hypothetical protein